MLIGVSSQVEIFHITSILALSGPVTSNRGTIDVHEYDDQYQFFVISERRPVGDQIDAVRLPDTNRVILVAIEWAGDNVHIARNAEELEEFMVLTMTMVQKHKIANRIFGQFSFRENVELGYQMLQAVTGRYDVSMEEWVGANNDPPPAGGGSLFAPRVQIVDEEEGNNDPPPAGNNLLPPAGGRRLFPIKRIREETCIICKTEPSTVLLDCGHECLCSDCADRWIGTVGQCTICRQHIVKMYQ